MLILPDADMAAATRITCDSAFGCAGQRCLAVSVPVTVGDARESFTHHITEAADSIRVGNGLQEDVQMAPVITVLEVSHWFEQRDLKRFDRCPK